MSFEMIRASRREARFNKFEKFTPSYKRTARIYTRGEFTFHKNVLYQLDVENGRVDLSSLPPSTPHKRKPIEKRSYKLKEKNIIYPKKYKYRGSTFSVGLIKQIERQLRENSQSDTI